MTQRATIRTRVIAELEPLGATVLRTLLRPIRIDQLPARVVESVIDERDDGEDDDSSVARRRLTIAVTHAITAGVDDPQGELEDAIEETIAALLADPTLGGAAIWTQEGTTEWGVDEREHITALARVELEIMYQSARDAV